MGNNQCKEFFDNHAPHYMENVFTSNTVAEVDFILEVTGLAPGSRILDVGCGTGRHSIELARRGYRVTGIDVSSGMLAQARAAAAEAGVVVDWVQADAAQFTPSSSYDAAICLCEGAFCLLDAGDDPDEHDLSILKNVASALKAGSPLVLTTLNGYAKIRKATQEAVENGSFDPLTLVESFTIELELPEGKKNYSIRERGYLPQDLKRLLGQAWFETVHTWGGTAGNWGKRRVDLDEIEIMVIARLKLGLDQTSAP